MSDASFLTEIPLRPQLVCPASAEAGHRLECLDCLLCGGTEGRRGPDIVIKSHGNRKIRARALDGWER